MNNPAQVQFAVPMNLEDASMCDAKVHVGFVIKSSKNYWRFQYANGSKRTMNKDKWSLYGNLYGARAALTKLLQDERDKTMAHARYLEELMQGDML